MLPARRAGILDMWYALTASSDEGKDKDKRRGSAGWLNGGVASLAMGNGNLRRGNGYMARRGGH